MGLSQVTLWRSGTINEKIFLQFNENRKIQKIETYKMGNDSLELFSIEKYNYSEGLIKEQYFKDYQWIGNRVGNHKFLRETTINYHYDDYKRIKTSIVNAKMDDRITSDTVRYFYKGDATIPFEVHKRLENRTKYFIGQTNNTLKIEKKTPYEDGFYIKTDSLTFDNKQRVVEYLSNERLEPQKFLHVYWKYEVTYPADSSLSQVPNLVFPFKSEYPKRSLNSFIESIVNSGIYKDAEIRTDIEYNFIPKTVLVHRSNDGKNWTLKSKLILHE